ncbi:glycosyltransferase family 4 protein [Rhodopirellula sallentina]|uniref:Group 1 glycosyl transferase n=1 Tax=Rhodopirellula sallentina SM41 TaxID=1263870 RepID=M5UKD8_9BACT|nr:glycosyltransferase family 1 protein [Rhodopirellula sallentina]EMI56488.1 group 1 glycosyl transferase [Rhodopirellula sallentina SM41]
MIRVGFDVSFAAPKPGRTAAVTGVGRVIESVLVNLREIPDLDVKAVGAFDGDWNPVSTSIMAQRWTSKAVSASRSSIPAYRSRMGFSKVLAPLQIGLESRSNLAARFNPWSLPAKLLRRFVRCDLEAALDHRTIDVFCSTFLPPPAIIPATIPRVVMIHDIYPARHPAECGPAATGLLNTICNQLNIFRDVVVTVSEYTKSDFCDYTQFPPSRVVVAPLAAADNFRPVDAPHAIGTLRSSYGLGNAPYILSVANAQPRKNLPAVIQAFAAVANRLPSWNGNLVLAGNSGTDWGTSHIEAELSKHPAIQRRTLRIGPVADSHLPTLYSEALAFVFPSLFEGFGLPVLEAMQCGTPVVCSSTTSLPEVVQDAAIQVPPQNVEEIANAVSRIISDRSLAQSMTDAGRTRATCFGWEKTVSQVAAAIRFAANTGV